jgi:peptidoglycan-N-acetylglucosamine deacetylase
LAIASTGAIVPTTTVAPTSTSTSTLPATTLPATTLPAPITTPLPAVPPTTFPPPTTAAFDPTAVVAPTGSNAVPRPLGQVISRVDTTKKQIAITFDSNMTDDMLAKLDKGTVETYANTEVVDILEREQVPATFFLAAKWVQRYPELTKRLVSSPLWEVGSHSYQHKGFTPKCYTLSVLPPSQMAEDVTKSFDTLRPFGGNQVPYFRFPGLCVDDAAMAAIAPTNVTVIHGDVASGDAFGTNAQAITDQVLRLAKSGSIVVMHITKANAPKTQDALPGIIKGLRNKGYELVKVSQLLTAGPTA